MVFTISENKWVNFDGIYYEYGAIVLLFDNCETAIRSFNRLQKAEYDDKKLLVLILPHLQVSTLFIDLQIGYI